VNFKNALEQNMFEAATRVCGANASIEHNKTIEIEVAIAREVASFAGPPKKEIDVITAGFKQSPAVKLLVSSKDFGNSKSGACSCAGMGGCSEGDESIFRRHKISWPDRIAKWFYPRL
jgi:hypothetical protein